MDSRFTIPHGLLYRGWLKCTKARGKEKIMVTEGAQDTFAACPREGEGIGTMKGVGRIYQQAFVDTYSKVAFAKLYTDKTPITSADLLNDRVVPFFDEQDSPTSHDTSTRCQTEPWLVQPIQSFPVISAHFT